MVECVAKDNAKVLNLVDRDGAIDQKLQMVNKFLSGVEAERGKWVEVKVVEDIQMEISSKPSDD